ncbi:MAG: hypothetical protein HUJ25_12470 [Crocinitomicaceae bacterium]|nr:hypothetical protein [Crocinitomicaceae bacterium]
MKRHLIHIEQVKKAGAKLQFQIRLPRRISKITGIQVTVVPKAGDTLPTPPPPDGEDVPPGEEVQVGNVERGRLRLRIPEKRDVFYAEDIFYPTHALGGYYDFNEPGLARKTEWWFTGGRSKYFSTDIPIVDTLVEAYYEDNSVNANPGDTVNYDLKIYFKLNDYIE